MDSGVNSGVNSCVNSRLSEIADTIAPKITLTAFWLDYPGPITPDRSQRANRTVQIKNSIDVPGMFRKVGWRSIHASDRLPQKSSGRMDT